MDNINYIHLTAVVVYLFTTAILMILYFGARNKYVRERARYNALFCEKKGCRNLKYFKFRVCANHLEGEHATLSGLDPMAMEGDRPSDQKTV